MNFKLYEEKKIQFARAISFGVRAIGGKKFRRKKWRKRKQKTIEIVQIGKLIKMAWRRKCNFNGRHGKGVGNCPRNYGCASVRASALKNVD